MATTSAKYSKRWRENNRDRFNELARNWRAKNKDKVSAYNKKRPKNAEARRRHHLKKTYGLSLEEYNQKLVTQNGVCAICKQPELSIRRGSYKSLDVDHNHETGEIRGLLCSACNAALGLLKEDAQRIESLLAYLRFWGGK